MHNLKYPTDEQLRLLDISSNNNLPSVLFELESIFIFFRGTLRLFFVKYLFGEEKQILRRIFYSLRTAKNFYITVPFKTLIISSPKLTQQIQIL